MYMCWQCGKIFDEPAVEYDDPSPDGVSLTPGAYKIYHCPRCGSEHIEETKECPMCGFDHISSNVLCADCQHQFKEDLEELRTRLGLNEEDFEQAICDCYGW